MSARSCGIVCMGYYSKTMVYIYPIYPVFMSRYSNLVSKMRTEYTFRATYMD